MARTKLVALQFILAVLTAAVSVYSVGYLKEFEGKRNIAVFGFLLHILPLIVMQDFFCDESDGS